MVTHVTGLAQVSELVSLENERREKLFLEEEARAELFRRVEEIIITIIMIMMIMMIITILRPNHIIITIKIIEDQARAELFHRVEEMRTRNSVSILRL